MGSEPCVTFHSTSTHHDPSILLRRKFHPLKLASLIVVVTVHFKVYRHPVDSMREQRRDRTNYRALEPATRSYPCTFSSDWPTPWPLLAPISREMSPIDTIIADSHSMKSQLMPNGESPSANNFTDPEALWLYPWPWSRYTAKSRYSGRTLGRALGPSRRVRDIETTSCRYISSNRGTASSILLF